MLPAPVAPGPPEDRVAAAAWPVAARYVVQPGAGHYPWLDDAGQFASAVTAFLNDGS
jgi:proline iminopeptidase